MPAGDIEDKKKGKDKSIPRYMQSTETARLKDQTEVKNKNLNNIHKPGRFMNQSSNRVQGMSLEELVETESQGNRHSRLSFNQNLHSPKQRKEIYTIDESNTIVSSPRNLMVHGGPSQFDATSSNRNNVTQIVSEGPKNMANRASMRESSKQKIKKINLSKVVG